MFEKTLKIINTLKIADPQTIGSILVYHGADWRNPTSERENARKHLNNLADLGKITKGSGFFRSLDCQSEYKDHAKLLTQHLSTVLKTTYNPIIYREKATPIGLIPDSLICLENKGKHKVIILEVCQNETYEYLMKKYREWQRWKGALPYLSELFGIPVKHVCFCVEGKEVKEAVTLAQALN